MRRKGVNYADGSKRGEVHGDGTCGYRALAKSYLANGGDMTEGISIMNLSEHNRILKALVQCANSDYGQHCRALRKEMKRFGDPVKVPPKKTTGSIGWQHWATTGEDIHGKSNFGDKVKKGKDDNSTFGAFQKMTCSMVEIATAFNDGHVLVQNPATPLFDEIRCDTSNRLPVFARVEQVNGNHWIPYHQPMEVCLERSKDLQINQNDRNRMCRRTVKKYPKKKRNVSKKEIIEL